MKQTVPSQTYLVRLWPTLRGGAHHWRVSLEGVAMGEPKYFADLEGLLAFLQAQAEEGEQIPEGAER